MARVAPHPEAFSVSRPGKSTKRVKDSGYLGFIAKLPCLITRKMPVECAHLSTANQAYGHPGRAKSAKASDRWCLPLAPDMHAIQHRGSEAAFWASHGIDPHAAASVLYGLFCERGMEALPEATRLITTRALAGVARRSLYERDCND